MEEIIRIFNKENIRSLLIGGQAIRLMGMPRLSMDWDFYIPGKDIENISKINRPKDQDDIIFLKNLLGD